MLKKTDVMSNEFQISKFWKFQKDLNNRKKEKKACEDWLKQVSDLGQEGSEQKSDKAA